MYYNFESAFDEAYNKPEFKRFMRGYKLFYCIKWGLLAVLLGVVALIVFRFNGDSDLFSNICVSVIFGIILVCLYFILFPRFDRGGRRERMKNAFNDFLSNVLKGCFNKEISVSETDLSRADYERSCPEQRYRDFEAASFYIDDIGITVKTCEAEIKICSMVVLEAGTHNIEIYNNTLMTKMIFAAASFPEGFSLKPDNDRVKRLLGGRAEKIFLSDYENTLYIEIDYKDISVKGTSKKPLQKSCLDVCENVSLLLEIVEKIEFDA